LFGISAILSCDSQYGVRKTHPRLAFIIGKVMRDFCPSRVEGLKDNLQRLGLK